MRVAYHNPVGLFICGLFYVSVSKTIINNKQGDLYQVLEYARKRDIQDVYLLYSHGWTNASADILLASLWMRKDISVL